MDRPNSIIPPLPPSGAIIQEVDVRIVSGVFVPCKGCYWYRSCVVPLGPMLPNIQRTNINYGDSDIKLHSWDDRPRTIRGIYYHCLDYTFIPRR